MKVKLPNSVRSSFQASVEKELYSTPLGFLSPFISIIVEGALSSRFRTRLLPAVLIISVLFLCTLILNLPVGGTQERQFLIGKGVSAREIAEMLEAGGFIRSAPIFTLMAKFMGSEKALRAGRHSLKGEMSTIAVIKELTRGGTLAEDVTIPEGLTSERIASVLARKVGVDSTRFMELVNDPELCRELGIDAPSLEGYLFPNTYNFHRNTDERPVIERMVGEFQRVFGEDFRGRAAELGFSVHQMVTLASVIEKESRDPDERKIISEIFHKRLKIGRALESCATVEYALGTHKERLSYSDLKVKSPYNTYTNRGLPPGPISNPGYSSIVAALYPADTGYLYFQARGDGKNIFSKSISEHANMKRELRKEDRGR